MKLADSGVLIRLKWIIVLKLSKHKPTKRENQNLQDRGSMKDQVNCVREISEEEGKVE